MSISKTIVVKLGTSVLTGGSYTLDKAHMVELVRQCAQLRQQGHKVILVSSGAVAAGKEHLHLSCDLSVLANKQMLAAVGQSQLILTWQTLFNIYGIHVGQMLLTRADLEDRERYLNARDTLHALLKHHIVPIINENDAVATAEIKVGDNDNLSALTAILAQADQLLLLTDQPGLFTADPRSNPDATLITEVNKIDDNLRALAGGSGTNLGTGGMATKLQAADAARRAGIETIIAAGHRPNVIIDTVNQTGVGTRFKALESAIEGRKRWLLAGPSSSGKLVLDAGATDAIVLQGSSLLAKGVKQVKGLFERGDLVELVTVQGEVIAKGICRYSSIDLDKIKTLHSEQIKAVLGFDNGKVVIHRDDLVLLDD
ncbi:glutamate 5-kinase [Pseudoalteromonas tunicata]|uniref:glutamate 5-kinase n=1 Tax=Pseudoalteromonas tunicata TaxID=314281 RepID=UPI00273FB947|nr:glutamate 5-kinase [Pseudoalteromonas tunicata]MDP5214018.1 glutamate 5-kinase [Pseudoalteromonas tunicata]